MDGFFYLTSQILLSSSSLKNCFLCALLTINIKIDHGYW